jgi:hypothetical protein
VHTVNIFLGVSENEDFSTLHFLSLILIIISCQEWGYEDVRDLFRSASDAENATLESKRKAFDKICENFSPGKIFTDALIFPVPTPERYLIYLVLCLTKFLASSFSFLLLGILQVIHGGLAHCQNVVH